MFTPNKNPAAISGADVITHENISLDFGFLPTVELNTTSAAPDQASLKIAEHQLATKIYIINKVNELSEDLVNKIALYLSPENTKTTLQKQALEVFLKEYNTQTIAPEFYIANAKPNVLKQAVDQCLEEASTNWKQAETAITEAQTKLLILKPEYEQIKQAISTIQTLLEDPSAKIVSLQQKINQNLAEIKTLESGLEPALRRLDYTVQAAQAIDPSLIKHVFDPQKQSIEAIVLNKPTYVNNAELFVKASKVVNESDNQIHQLKGTLQEKLTAYQKIKATHEAFKSSLPDKLDEAQLQKAQTLGIELEKAIEEYKSAKAPVDKIEAAKNYLNYHDNWSQLTEKDIATAKLIEAKKQENNAISESIDNLISPPPKIEPYLEKLSDVSDKINQQEKIVLDNQILSKTHQATADYFQAETQKLAAMPMTEHEAHFDAPILPDMALQSPLADIAQPTEHPL